MRLFALRSIQHTAGTIPANQVFDSDEVLAQKLIEAGAAIPEEKQSQAPWTGEGYWRVQPEWQGERCVILAGGPSVTPEQVAVLERARPKLIAINNAVELTPWADILYFCDDRWYGWHRTKVQAFVGRRVTLENLKLQNEIEVRSLRDYGVSGFAPRNDGVTNGRNGGYQALHLAAWLGAARVLLVGFDMRQVNGRMHWHEEHPASMSPQIFESWLEQFAAFEPELRKRSVDVINCTPDSALKAFPYLPLERALEDD